MLVRCQHVRAEKTVSKAWSQVCARRRPDQRMLGRSWAVMLERMAQKRALAAAGRQELSGGARWHALERSAAALSV